MNTLRNGVTCLALLSAPFVVSAQTFSNGLGGGDWSSPSTWALGAKPTGAFSVEAGDTVTVGAGDAHSTSNASFVHGTLVLEGGDIQVGRVNNGVESFGTINLNSGRFSASRVAHTSSSRVLVNISGGTFEIRDNIAISNGITFNISGGELLTNSPSINHTSASGALIHMTGGRLVFEGGNSGIGALANGSWNGGAVYLNSSTMSVGVVTPIINAWTSNAGNILGISSKASRQTLNMNTGVEAAQGIMAFNIYSAGLNDNDLFASNQLILGEDVSIRISGVELEGSIQDYIGASYQLFSVANGDYSSIGASVEDSSLIIGGIQYDDIRWDTTNLAINGSISLVPEPSTYALAAGALALGVVVLRRRKTARQN